MGESALKIVVLASGEGSNLQAIIDKLHGKGEVEVVGVGSDKPACRALERAIDAGIATRTFERSQFGGDRAARDAAIADWIESTGAELVVLAGYMQVLSPLFVQRFARRVINVHPSLLPEFPGLDAIEQAVDAGVERTGVTVHFVDEQVDHGPVIVQREVPIEPDTQGVVDLDVLTERIHAVEHDLLPSTIGAIARGNVATG